MKFEQVFGIYLVTVDLSENTFWVTSDDFNLIYLDVFHNNVTWHELPASVKCAFEIVNVCHECLALANTKNLSVDLLVELGYTESNNNEGDSAMNLTKQELKDKIFELETELDKSRVPDELWHTASTNKTFLIKYKIFRQETKCWIEYYKQLLQELEQGE